jgi:hypothetical protein
MDRIEYMHQYHGAIFPPLQLREYLRIRRIFVYDAYPHIYLPVDGIWYRKPVARTQFAANMVIDQASGG